MRGSGAVISPMVPLKYPPRARSAALMALVSAMISLVKVLILNH
jgi:hypothetical protein